MENEDLALVERHGARGELILNRPERRNALVGPLVAALHAGFDELVADDTVNAILIRGAGGSFCAGLDLDAFGAEPPPPWRATFGEQWAGFHATLYGCPKPIIGALEGPAIAAGSALALACDMLIAGAGCRFQVAEAKLGMAAPVNVVWLQLKFGVARALELAVGAQPMDGVALVARGIALAAVPDDAVLTEARAYADRIAQNKPSAMAAIKATIRALNGSPDFGERIGLAQQFRPAQSGPGAGLRGR